MAEYNYHVGGSTDWNECPYGEFRDSSNVYEWSDPYSNRVIFMTRTDFRQVPGHSECGSDWQNWETDRVRHLWDGSDLTNPGINSDEPSGVKDGTISHSLSIGTGGAGLSWTYTQPDVTMENLGTSVRARWNWVYNTENAQNSTETWEVGSECEFDSNQSPSSGDWLVITSGRHTFAEVGNTKENQISSLYQYK